MSESSGHLRLRRWQDIDWVKTFDAVKGIRQQIFRASQCGDKRKLRSLQRLMLQSRANAEFSVRQATQINKGRRTPGIDDRVALRAQDRTDLVAEILTTKDWKAQPVKRTNIPKGNGQTRPLGIPVIADRCKQAMVRNALEPAWEAQFEPCSYGFRPGRSCHDAIGRIFRLALPHSTKKWILDADIKGAFDNISHEHIINSLRGFPGLPLVDKWLKAGVMIEGVLHSTDKGTPQGGVISPLLLNIALHGMESSVGVVYKKRDKYTSLTSNVGLVRYADDFVVFGTTEEECETAMYKVSDWLGERGLELSEEKTNIKHLTNGFDFLGFTIKEYRERLADKPVLLITPSKESVLNFRQRMRTEWDRLKGHSVDYVMTNLNPILRGWGNYFRHVASTETFNKLSRFNYRRSALWGRKTHNQKSAAWLKSKYMCVNVNGVIYFGNAQTGQYLLQLQDIKIDRHILIRHGASPDNPDERQYWEKRAKRSTELLPTVRHERLATTQGGECPECQGTLYGDEKLEIHHRIPKSRGGSNRLDNLQLVHRTCHEQLTSRMFIME